ncbi:MAG: methyltransferase domain-containing protein [Acidobacteriota bacterium]
MREDLVSILRCPETGASLELVDVGSWFALDAAGDVRFVVDGLLETVGERRLTYAILDEVPRLVPRPLWHEDERAYVLTERQRDASFAEDRRVEPEIFTQSDLEAEIRRRMERRYDLAEGASTGDDDSVPQETLRRLEGEIRYMTAESRGTNKRKYLEVIRPRLDAAPTILETGGNFPGLTRLLQDEYTPERAVVANIQVVFPRAFKTPDRSIDAVRADVQALPFTDGSFDLVASAFMLEHVPDWKVGLENMMRVARHTFLAFGPNKWFPIEVGHIDAPLAGSLPAPIDGWIAWLWLKAIGKPRPMHRIHEILGEVFHVGAKAFARHARHLGGQAENLFPEIVDVIVADQNAPATGPRKLLKRHPKLATVAARTLATVGMEPQIYYWIESR